MNEQKRAIHSIKVTERIIYIVIIAVLLLVILFQSNHRQLLKDDNHIVVKKAEVLDKYTQSLNKIIKEKEVVLSHVAQSDKDTKQQLQDQIALLNQKKEEIRQLKKSRQLDFKKLMRISSELEQMRQKDEALQTRFASLEDSVRLASGANNSSARTGISSEEYHHLQEAYKRAQIALQQALENNSLLSGKVFATNFIVRPGEIRRGRFSPSTRARRTTQLRVEFKLTRPLKPGEKLLTVMTHDQKDFPLKEVFRNELKDKRRLTMNLTPILFKKFKRGNSTLAIYLETNGQKSKIGSHVLYLR